VSGRKDIRLIKIQWLLFQLSLSFVRASAHPGCPGLKGRKTVDDVVVVVVIVV